AGGQAVEHVIDGDPQAPDAGLAAALARLDRDQVLVVHAVRIPRLSYNRNRRCLLAPSAAWLWTCPAGGRGHSVGAGDTLVFLKGSWLFLGAKKRVRNSAPFRLGDLRKEQVLLADVRDADDEDAHAALGPVDDPRRDVDDRALAHGVLDAVQRHRSFA